MSKTRDEKVKELLAEVTNWDIDTLVEFAQDEMEEEYNSMSSAEIDEVYEDSGLDVGSGSVPIQIVVEPDEEKCPTCKRMKDAGSKCWCCGN
jgi:hypothetical protein